MIKLERHLPDWIDGFMLYTENTEPPVLYRKWTAISVIAAVLQRKCRVEWGTSLTFYPNLYVVLVGPSATGKGTAMSPGLDLLQDLKHIKIAAQATSLQALIRRLKETNYSDPDLETGEVQLHSSMTIFSKEFTVFLGYHNRELMATLCDWYDCDRHWIYETISRKTEEIVGVWVNIVAATTPDLIRSSMPLDAIGGGLTSRIIYIFEERKAKLVPLPMQTSKEKGLYIHLLHDLEKIYMLSGCFKYTTDFMDIWTDWCNFAEKNPPFSDPKFDGYLGRRRSHVMKLSMIMCASRYKEQNQMVITRDDFERALVTLEEAEKRMLLVFRGVGKSDYAEAIQSALTFFKTSVTKEIPIWQFARQYQNDLDKFAMDRVLQTLEVMNVIKVIHRPGIPDCIKVLDAEQSQQPPSGNSVQKSNTVRGKETLQ